jgi:gliding motility-associated-like protein
VVILATERILQGGVPAPQTYTSPGNYNITAMVSNAAGCSTTDSTVLRVSGLPTVDAGADTIICSGQSFILNPSGADTYQWNYDSSLSCTLCSSPVAKPAFNVKYAVTGITSIGCRNTDSITVQVIQPFKLRTIANDTLCMGEPANLWARGAETYTWSPSETLSNANSENPIAKPAASTVYNVVGYDRYGCFTDTALVPVIVYTNPEFNIVPDKISLGNGGQATITTTNSPDVNSWRWSPATDMSCYNCAQPVVTGRANITYMAIAANPAGCTAQDNVTIQVFCNEGNVYIPNTFSPNSDGMNDVFFIRGKGITGIKSLRIFNRWGTAVFSKLNLSVNEPGAGWDGRYNGQPLTPDVFVYEAEIICDNNEVFPMKGNVTLIK